MHEHQVKRTEELALVKTKRRDVAQSIISSGVITIFRYDSETIVHYLLRQLPLRGIVKASDTLQGY
jgi:hypothetical protein